MNMAVSVNCHIVVSVKCHKTATKIPSKLWIIKMPREKQKLILLTSQLRIRVFVIFGMGRHSSVSCERVSYAVFRAFLGLLRR